MLAYITREGMRVWDGAAVRPLTSQRIRQYEQNARELEEKYEWRSSGSGAQFMRQENPYKGASEQTGEVSAVALTGERLLYAACFPELGGLYLKNPLDDKEPERLVMAERGFSCMDVCCDGERFAASVGTGAQCHIALFSLSEPGYTFVTEGDTVDVSPFLRGDALWYASAGIGRDENRRVAGMSPLSLMRLRLSDMTLEETLSSDQYDYLRPRADGDGTLYCIRRPHARARDGATVKDALLVPVRLVKAIAGFLTAFTKLFAKEGFRPESRDGAERVKTAPEEKFSVEGMLLASEQNLRENERRGEEFPGYAPSSWELIRAEDQSVLRRGVVDYAFASDGALIYTNGRHILRVGADGGETLLLEDKGITRISLA